MRKKGERREEDIAHNFDSADGKLGYGAAERTLSDIRP